MSQAFKDNILLIFSAIALAFVVAIALYGCAPRRVRAADPTVHITAWKFSKDGTYAYSIDEDGQVFIITKQPAKLSEASRDLGMVGTVENLGQVYYLGKKK